MYSELLSKLVENSIYCIFARLNCYFSKFQSPFLEECSFPRFYETRYLPTADFKICEIRKICFFEIKEEIKDCFLLKNDHKWYSADLNN